MRRSSLILFLVVIVAFGVGFVHLMNLRFEAGDSYPAYSSLRADPLGTKALFESLEPLLLTRRNLQPIAKLRDGRDTTLLWLGENAQQVRFQPAHYDVFDAFLRTGGRLVIGFKPVPRKPLPNTFLTGGPVRAFRGGRTNAPPAPNRSELDREPGVPPGEHWGFDFDYEELPKENSTVLPTTAFLRATNESPPLPRSLLTHTTLFLGGLTPDWRVIYARLTRTNEQAVVAERRFGKGSLVLVADPYLFSNEAMLKDRETALLAWLIGDKARVVFDETHLGVSVEPGIATLARKYRLHGVFAALLMLAVLFIWKNAVSFMPPYEEQLARERGDVIEGKDSAAGFVNLLRRSLAPADLMKACLEQWNAHSTSAQKPSDARLAAMQQVINEQNALEPRQRNPVGTYRRFCEILSRTTRHSKLETNNRNDPRPS